MVDTIKIKNVNNNQSSLTIEWDDGEKSNFNFLWLRDNCPSDIHPTARERQFNLKDVSENIKPESFKVENNEKIEIKWSEGNHTSLYDISWLRRHCYTINNSKPYVSPYKLWDKSLSQSLEKITAEYEEVMETEEGLIKWLEKLHHYGICIVKNTVTSKNSGFEILKRISHTRQTFFGTPFEVINIPNPNNQAYTSKGLFNHTDLPYFESAPGYQFLHCLVNDATGGNSSIADGFKVADYLRKNDEEVFKTLIQTPVKFTNNDYTQETVRIGYSPLINLNKDNDYNDMRFSVAQMGVIDCAPDLVEKFYKSYHKFAKLLHSKEYLVEFRLEKGDLFCFNNRRVVHGRTEFNPNSGHRHLQGYYIDRDEILGRMNYLKKVEL
tara:strand:- start:56 stop:1198 length:1143 start_codon:yes stop_codon:yes gene_type:complete